MGGFVHIVTNRPFGTLYTGVTSNLPKRIWEHREGAGSEFTRRYNCKRLVWFEMHDEIAAAIIRETQIKRWNRKWKEELVTAFNPDWAGLFEQINA